MSVLSPALLGAAGLVLLASAAGHLRSPGTLRRGLQAQGVLGTRGRRAVALVLGPVEGVLGAHPAVKDVAAVGLPHDKWGEAVNAVVVLHRDTRVDEAELLDWCRGRLAGYKRPREVRFIESLPRTANGKITRRDLR